MKTKTYSNEDVYVDPDTDSSSLFARGPRFQANFVRSTSRYGYYFEYPVVLDSRGDDTSHLHRGIQKTSRDWRQRSNCITPLIFGSRAIHPPHHSFCSLRLQEGRASLERPTHTMIDENSTIRGGCIVLIDAPPATSITLDGVTRVTPSTSTSDKTSLSNSTPFNRGLFIVANIPSSAAPLDTSFHLLIVRCGRDLQKSSSNNGDCRSLPVGFVLTNPTATQSNSNHGYEWIFARRYKPETEEMSNEPLDELTLNNLMVAIEERGELKRYVMPYEQFMGVNRGGSSRSNTITAWKARALLVNQSYLMRRHDLYHGDKIVPSSDTSIDDALGDSTKSSVDGKPVSYPPIPCIDPNVGARQLTQHSGTKVYLSGLSPEMRTWLLFGGAGSKDAVMGNKTSSPGEYVWKDVMRGHYGREDANVNACQSESDFLADIQLSFLLFLFMECHASLEHWRDAVSMCSLSTVFPGTNSSQSNSAVLQHPTFFLQLMSILKSQMACIETEFFQEVEYSSGESNFLIAAMRRLCNACKMLDETNESSAELRKVVFKLQKLAMDRFHVKLTSQSSALGKGNNYDDDVDMEIDLSAPHNNTKSEDNNARHDEKLEMNLDDESDDEDGPVIVSCDDVEASLARSCVEAVQAQKFHRDQSNLSAGNEKHRQCYPLLFAAMSPQEDIVMTCARVLEEAKDVSLVRQAAAYLEEVEARRF